MQGTDGGDTVHLGESEGTWEFFGMYMTYKWNYFGINIYKFKLIDITYHIGRKSEATLLFK